MLPTESTNRTLEIYSGNRNRRIYPNASSFSIPFAASFQNGQNIQAQDPICGGGVYYKFTYTPQTLNPTNPYPTLDPTKPVVVYTSAIYAPGSTRSRPILQFGLAGTNQIMKFDSSSKINFIKDFYKGFTIVNVGINGVPNSIGETRKIRSYDPTTNAITLDRPFTVDPVINGIFAQGFGCYLISPSPTKYSVYIPTVDNNLSSINTTPLYYNGYYVLFQTPFEGYSSGNRYFSRQIVYYDNIDQIAYFKEPLPFDYENPVFPYTPPTTNQFYTLRQSLPFEKWDLDTASYYNTSIPTNPFIGPLQGYVVVLPSDASSVDNYYKGKYLYLPSVGAQIYSPPLPPQNEIKYPISPVFYPIYGLFYIYAYNGTTKECSIQVIENNNKNTQFYVNSTVIPSYILMDLNSSSIQAGVGVTSVLPIGPGEYQATLNGATIIQDTTSNQYTFTLKIPTTTVFVKSTVASSSNIFRAGKRYKFKIRVKQTGLSNCYFHTFNVNSPYFSIDDNLYNGASVYVDSVYQEYEFVNIINSDAGSWDLEFYFDISSGLTGTLEWDLLSVYEQDTVNIINFEKDNYTPLDYNGTMVDTNQTVCYDIKLVSITLPNKALLTGSRIAFYPFIYVQLENLTSPNKHSGSTIISNNPNSANAIFPVSVPQVSSPDIQQFVTLYSPISQNLNFKPNDNLYFSVYLSDGSPFQTLVPDTYTPYPPDKSFQIDAIFSITRRTS